MKKLYIITLLAALASAAFAQDGEPILKISGDAKTGIFYEQSQQDGGEVVVEELKVENHDGDPNGNRFRLDMEYDNGKNIGFKSRLQWDVWNNDNTAKWSYAFGYGNFFDDQLTVSVGKLGGSPWGTGGDMWKELEANGVGGGMRVEWKPGFIPERFGKINVGFVLNYFNADRDQGTDNTMLKITLLEILKESVLGISYTNDWFMIRAAYRFDSEVDASQNNKFLEAGGQGEDELVYRIEANVFNTEERNYGLRLWALGHLAGLSAKNKEIQQFRNWFFIQYDPPALGNLEKPLTAQISVGNDASITPDQKVIGEFFVKPSFYWHFFDNRLLTVGSSYKITFDYGAGGIEGNNPYYYMEIEPKIQLNFSSSWIAMVYNFRQEYIHEDQALSGREPIKQKQWINLRFCIQF